MDNLDNFINILFISSLVLLAISRYVLIPNISILTIRSNKIENQNITTFIGIATLICIIIVSLDILKFTYSANESIFYNFFKIFLILLIFRILVLFFTFIFYLMIGQEIEFNPLKNDTYFFIGMNFIIIISFIVLYLNISQSISKYILLLSLGLIIIIQWIISLSEKKDNKLYSYYDFLYLFILKILPIVCLFKILFPDEFNYLFYS